MKLNFIHKGDCLQIIPKIIKDKSIDMIFTDLPYGTTNCRWDSVIELPKLWAEYERVIKDTGAILLFAQTPFDKVLGASNLKLLKYEWVWEKTQATGHLNAKKAPMKTHENILVFYKKPPTYNPQKTFGHKRKISSVKHRRNSSTSKIYGYQDNLSGYDSTERYPRSVQVFANDTQKSKLHPTQKPLLLIEYMVKTYTNEGDLVLDSCAGSGTVGVACEILNRNWIMIEKDPKTFDVANKRLNSLLL